MLKRFMLSSVLFLLTVSFAGCGGGSGGGGSGGGGGGGASVELTGSIDYLNSGGGTVTLTNEESGETLVLDGGETTFAFSDGLSEGASFSVVSDSYDVAGAGSVGWGCDVADGSGTLVEGNNAVAVSCGRYIAFNPLDGFVDSDGLITLLFQTYDPRDGSPISVSESGGDGDTPDIGDFALAEMPLSEDSGEVINIEDEPESFFAIVPRETLNYTLRTVIAIDASVSAAEDLPTIKAAALRQVTDDFTQDSDTGEITCAPDAASKLSEAQLVSILVFGADVEPATSFTRNTQVLCQDIKDIATITGTTTRQFEAVNAGLDLWETSFTVGNLSFGNLVMITDSRDGTITGETARQEEIDSIRARAANENKSIFMIGVGSEIDPDELGQENGMGVSGFFELDDFTDLEARLTDASEALQEIANSLSQLEYATSRRDGSYDALLTLPENAFTGVGEGLRGRYQAQDAWGAGVQPTLVATGDRNVQPGQQSRINATVRWTTDDSPVFAWDASGLNANVAVDDGGDNNDFIVLGGQSTGASSTLSLQAATNFGTLGPMSLTINATDVEASIPSAVPIPAESTLSVTALGPNAPSFLWSVYVSTGADCSISDPTSATPQLTVPSYSSAGSCTIQVSDTANSNVEYRQSVTVGSPGTTPIEVSVLGSASSGGAESYDFEGGFPADFTNDTVYPWEVSSDASTLSGGSTQSVRSSPSVVDGEYSAMSVTVGSPRTAVDFDYRVSSEACCDDLELRINGNVVQSYSGEVAWTRETVALDGYEGDITIEWRYAKDGSISEGDDAAWVDNVEIR